MGIDDIFHFSPAIYTTKVASLPTPELQQRETQKIRQILSGSCSVGLGVGTAAATGGITLGFAALAGRNIHVAKQKLEIIQAELLRRCAPLHGRLTTADKVIPVIGGVTGFLAGGVAEAALTVGDTAGVGGYIAPAELGPSTGDIIAANVVGGRVAASHRWALERLLHGGGKQQIVRVQEEARKAVGCTRLLGWDWLQCDGCEDVIEKGVYAHCCECDDNIDLCMACYDKTDTVPKCGGKERSHELVIRQISVSGLNDQAMIIKDFDRKRNMTGPARCSHCFSPILQGRIYTCGACLSPSGDLFNLCTNCYFLGDICPGATNHHLYIFLAARMPTGGTNQPPYESMFGSAAAQCNVCSQDIDQGSYYQCALPPCRTPTNPTATKENLPSSGGRSIPPESYFDICHTCYEKGATCREPSSHELTLYFSYSTSQNWRRVYKDADVWCDICKGKIRDGECYHCPVCLNGNYDICVTCYMTGSGCADPKHILVKLGLR